jgi:hypothetical protein
MVKATSFFKEKKRRKKKKETTLLESIAHLVTFNRPKEPTTE